MSMFLAPIHFMVYGKNQLQEQLIARIAERAAAEGWAWSVIRVIPGAACSGQAAGMAAALSLRHGETAATLPPRRLIDALRAEGVWPHLG